MKRPRKSVKPARRYDDPKCPECGAPLEIHAPCIVYDVYAKTPRDNPHRQRLTRAAFCTGCEFVIEF